MYLYTIYDSIKTAVLAVPVCICSNAQHTKEAKQEVVTECSEVGHIEIKTSTVCVYTGKLA